MELMDEEDLNFSDLQGLPMPHQEGLDLIDRFYPDPPPPAPPKPSSPLPPPAPPLPRANEVENITDEMQIEPAITQVNDDDPIASPMEDIQTLPEHNVVDNVVDAVETAVAEPQYDIPPNPYAVEATQPMAAPPAPQPQRSPTAESVEHVKVVEMAEKAAADTENMPQATPAPMVTPPQPKPRPPPSSTRFQMHDEMRLEENDEEVDVDDLPTPAKLALPGLATPRRSSSQDRTLDGQDLVAPSRGRPAFPSQVMVVLPRGHKHARAPSTPGKARAPAPKRARISTREVEALSGDASAGNQAMDLDEFDDGSARTAMPQASSTLPSHAGAAPRAEGEDVDSSLSEMELSPPMFAERIRAAAPSPPESRVPPPAAAAAARTDSVVVISDDDSVVSVPPTKTTEQPAQQPKANQTKGKNKEVAPAPAKAGPRKPSTGLFQPPTRNRGPSKREVDDLVSSTVMANLGVSTRSSHRQTRRQRKQNENAKPSAAAKRRHSRGGDGK